jgi:hypothetical protein
MQILPPESKVAVRRRRERASDSGVARADAAAFIVSDRDPAAALARLPHADLWRSLHSSAGRRSKAPPLVSRRSGPASSSSSSSR